MYSTIQKLESTFLNKSFTTVLWTDNTNIDRKTRFTGKGFYKISFYQTKVFTTVQRTLTLAPHLQSYESEKRFYKINVFYNF